MTTLRSEILDGTRVLTGAWSTMTDPFSAAILATAGYDWICIDEQHGSATPDRSVDLIGVAAAAGANTLVRVAANRPELIGRALDSGAAGVIVPMVQSAMDAAAAARASRYAPQGQRSWGPARALYSAGATDTAATNDAVTCLVMVETPDAVAQVDAIATTEGIDGIFVGPFDLSIALGIGVDELVGDRSPSAPLPSIVAACEAAGIAAGVYAGSVERAVALAAIGFTVIAVGSDADLLGTAAAATASEARLRLG
ncbi:HpcH/HpaI aldolase family protein [Marisediminicola senii]|uniref:HpcH/HpaI aldolase family protein n=1 Tax=Marisediminicola senii TaxID=2711233 RepID=UPI0013EA055C|nr:aldolase/citrate lyase family protein [Marisediminicola senii]